VRAILIRYLIKRQTSEKDRGRRKNKRERGKVEIHKKELIQTIRSRNISREKNRDCEKEGVVQKRKQTNKEE
jgi:hypothetical protein